MKSRTVHPRSCGEQPSYICTSFPAAGSSPLVRGTVDPILANAVPTRFIPARAGNSRKVVCICRYFPVHPRSCGEQTAAKNAFSQLNGSSPLVRGTVGESIAYRPNQRFIPARAGNSSWYDDNGHSGSVHPRSCGEQDLSL